MGYKVFSWTFGNKVEVTEEKLQINGCSMVNCRLIGGGIGIG